MNLNRLLTTTVTSLVIILTTTIITTNGFQPLSITRETPRDILTFQEWAGQCGVEAENGFCFMENLVDDNEEYYAATATGGRAGSRVLRVPNEMILSSARIAQDYEGYVQPSFTTIEQKGMRHLLLQFYLFLKILVEIEQGSDSPYYPWLNSLPRKYNTAVSMDDFCLECLPPFIKSLCQVKRNQLAVFREALQAFEYLSPEEKRMKNWPYLHLMSSLQGHGPKVQTIIISFLWHVI
jgi:hypothetical protein